MNAINDSSRKISDIIAEISAASGEQSTGMAGVGGTVTQLETMTQQNAAQVEQSAAAAMSLRKQADGLNTLVNTFRLA